ncbi:MAG: DUF6089 family protein [Flavobacteriales bacterium]|nr:DUF6089 family protein [Flavobacteriales bacterium]
MRAICFLLFSFVLWFNTQAQYNWEFGGTFGVANYLGEIGGKDKASQPWLLDLKMGQSRWNLGGFARYNWDFLSIRFDIFSARLQGADSLSTNPARVGRNLSFRNDIWEFTAKMEYVFFELHDVGKTGQYNTDFKAYLGLGAGVFWNNPKAKYQGDWHALQPLKLEAVNYSRWQFVAPFHLGFYYTLGRANRIGFEFGYRFTLTDYIDDISTNYRDTTGMDELQLALYSRPKTTDPDISSNIPHENNYKFPSPRGGSDSDDAYVTALITYSRVLKGKYKNKKFRTKSKRYLGQYKRRRRKAKAKF